MIRKSSQNIISDSNSGTFNILFVNTEFGCCWKSWLMVLVMKVLDIRSTPLNPRFYYSYFIFMLLIFQSFEYNYKIFTVFFRYTEWVTRIGRNLFSFYFLTAFWIFIELSINKRHSLGTQGIPLLQTNLLCHYQSQSFLVNNVANITCWLRWWANQ